MAISFKGGQSADGGLGVDEGVCQTMQSRMSAIEPTMAVAVDFYNQTIDPDTSMTIAAAAATDKNHIGGVAIGIGRDAFNSGENAQMAQSISDEVQPPMTAKGPGGGMHEWRTTKGDDVMPTLDTRLAAQVDKQMERNGSYLCGPME